MLKLITSDKLKKENKNIVNQIKCDVKYDGFNSTSITIKEWASAFSLWKNQEIELK